MGRSEKAGMKARERGTTERTAGREAASSFVQVSTSILYAPAAAPDMPPQPHISPLACIRAGVPVFSESHLRHRGVHILANPPPLVALLVNEGRNEEINNDNNINNSNNKDREREVS